MTGKSESYLFCLHPHEKQNLPHCETLVSSSFLRERRALPGAWDALRVTNGGAAHEAAKVASRSAWQALCDNTDYDARTFVRPIWT